MVMKSRLILKALIVIGEQGISLDLFGYFEFHDGNRHKDGTILWEDTCPKNVILKLWSEKKKRYKSKYLPEKNTLTLSNAWDKGDGAIWTVSIGDRQ